MPQSQGSWKSLQVWEALANSTCRCYRGLLHSLRENIWTKIKHRKLSSLGP